MPDHDPTTHAPDDGAAPDWRSDTVERRSPLVPDGRPAADSRAAPTTGPAGVATDETTHALPPVRLPVAGPHEPPAEMPRAARWPLWADGRPDVDSVADPAPARPTAAADRGQSTRTAVTRRLPLTAAAVAVAAALGAGGAWLLTPDEPAPYPRTVVGDPDFLDPDVTDGVPAGSVGEATPGLRPDGASRGSGRDDERDDEPGGATDGPKEDLDVEEVRSRATSVVDRVRPSAPVTAPPNESLTGERTTYGADNLVDGRPDTAWRMPGNGRGEVITLRLGRPTTLTSVGLLNGYAKTDRARGRTVDWYAANRRVRTVEWFFDDGSRVTQSLRQDRRMQTTDIEPVTTSVVRLRIAEVSPPGRGRDGRDFTAIGEVALDGVPARR